MKFNIFLPTASVMGALLLSTTTLMTLTPSSAEAAKVRSTGPCSLSNNVISANKHSWVRTKSYSTAYKKYSQLSKKLTKSPGSKNKNFKPYNTNSFTCVTMNKVRSGSNGRGSKLDTYVIQTYYALRCKRFYHDRGDQYCEYKRQNSSSTGHYLIK